MKFTFSFTDKTRRILPLALWMCILAFVAGCGETDKTAAPTQVVAKVNADEITVHQINYFLRKNQAAIDEGSGQAVKREILDKLIDQHLARQKAVEEKLDRSPDVLLAIEAAKSEILARAYLEQVASGVPKTSPWESEKYFSEHPELFSQRRVFELDEIAFKGDEALGVQIREQASRLNSAREIADWLKAKQVPFSANRGVRTAEQIPLEMLPKLQGMKDGEILVYEAGKGRFQVIRIVASKTDPVDLVTATPSIQQFLYAKRLTEITARQLKSLREQSKIEFLGEFANPTATASDQGVPGGKPDAAPVKPEENRSK